MRLLNSFTFQLEDFSANEIPPNTILSHKWGKGEVLFVDIESGSTDGKAGYKIRGSCDQAAADGLDYIWVDTCCMDKSRSAELLEAINSWYQRAGVCYAYLADVPPKWARDHDSAFINSRWFTRGGTLQELTAPSKLVFYSND
jgi:hypothetical protein